MVDKVPRSPTKSHAAIPRVHALVGDYQPEHRAVARPITLPFIQAAISVRFMLPDIREFVARQLAPHWKVASLISANGSRRSYREHLWGRQRSLLQRIRFLFFLSYPICFIPVGCRGLQSSSGLVVNKQYELVLEAMCKVPDSTHYLQGGYMCELLASRQICMDKVKALIHFMPRG